MTQLTRMPMPADMYEYVKSIACMPHISSHHAAALNHAKVVNMPQHACKVTIYPNSHLNHSVLPCTTYLRSARRQGQRKSRDSSCLVDQISHDA